MHVVTVTSDTYLESTTMLIESIRQWHPELAIVVYALSGGWTSAMTERLVGANVSLRMIREQSAADRGHAGQFCSWKLAVLAEQTSPFLYLDADILVLKPLDDAVRLIRSDGWLTAHDTPMLYRYCNERVRRLVAFAPHVMRTPSFNAGVIGCDPKRHGDIFKLARSYQRHVKHVLFGDQALLNIAWSALYDAPSPDAGTTFNGGWRYRIFRRDEKLRFDLTQTVLHLFCVRKKVPLQRKIWDRWPRGARFTAVSQTPFWSEWVRPALAAPTYCEFAERLAVARVKSGGLHPGEHEYIVARDGLEAFFLNEEVLETIGRRTDEAAGMLGDIPYLPTYHLRPTRCRRRARRAVLGGRSSWPIRIHPAIVDPAGYHSWRSFELAKQHVLGHVYAAIYRVDTANRPTRRA
jgi:hypothetical protein